jgi:hypothetical protein
MAKTSRVSTVPSQVRSRSPLRVIPGSEQRLLGDGNGVPASSNRSCVASIAVMNWSQFKSPGVSGGTGTPVLDVGVGAAVAEGGCVGEGVKDCRGLLVGDGVGVAGSVFAGVSVAEGVAVAVVPVAVADGVGVGTTVSVGVGDVVASAVVAGGVVGITVGVGANGLSYSNPR